MSSKLGAIAHKNVERGVVQFFNLHVYITYISYRYIIHMYMYIYNYIDSSPKKMTFFSATPNPNPHRSPLKKKKTKTRGGRCSSFTSQDVRRGVLELRRSLTAAVDRLVGGSRQGFPTKGKGSGNS